MRFSLFVLLFLLGITACNLEKEIEVDLPDYTEELVVECYLEPGQPYRMTLTQSLAYFSNEFLPVPVPGVVVKIKHQGAEVLLNEEIAIDTNFNKIYNYIADEMVPANYNEDFDLEITLPNGDLISSTTQILAPVSIDSLVLKYNIEEDTMALMLTYFEDDANQTNYYRRMLHLGESIRDGQLEQDFIADDAVFNGETVVFGTGFNYVEGDTLIASVFHVDESYERFFESAENAAQSNGNPFGSPASIQSNIEGGTGIFTGLSYVRDTLIVSF